MRKEMVAAAAVALAVAAGAAVAGEELTNLLALQEGTLVVSEAPGYGGWPAVNMIDDAPGSGWASESGRVRDNVFVLEMVAEATLQRFEFDTAEIDGDGRGAREVVVEVSTVSPSAGFTEILRATLADRADGQAFEAARRAPARWVRLTLLGNHGDPEWTELMSFRGLGLRPPPSPPAGDISGTYETTYSRFHLLRQGTALSGCYEYDEGLLTGTVEGRVMKITWQEASGEDDRGPAVMVFSPDGRSFRGSWWHGSDRGRPRDGEWDGQKVSSEVGSCPHWAGSVGAGLARELEATGRARLYGILFDLDSAVIRPESEPVLREVAELLAARPGLRLTIEGHTDASGTDVHNLRLSEHRAEAVRSWLVANGIAASRLATAGFGESRPVADNGTELGRAQNRRVELVQE